MFAVVDQCLQEPTAESVATEGSEVIEGSGVIAVSATEGLAAFEITEPTEA